MKLLPAVRFCSIALLLSLPMSMQTGCASSPTSTTPTPVPDQANLSGNWQASLSPAVNTAALSSAAGYINQAGAKTATGQFTTSVLQIAGDCFIAAPLIPLQGNNNAGAVTLDSYTVNGQTVHLVLAADATASSLTGTYSVNGGCANGATGSVTANRYAPLTGTYTGTLNSGASAGPAVTMNVTQNVNGTGGGTFLLTGTLSVTGTGCTMQGTAAAAQSNYAQGSRMQISFPATDGSGSTTTVTGTFDPAATTIGNVSLSVAGNSCAGLTASGTLKR